MRECPSSAKEVRPLFIGEKVPEGISVTDGEKRVSLEEVTGGNPFIVVFYRGGW